MQAPLRGAHKRRQEPAAMILVGQEEKVKLPEGD